MCGSNDYAPTGEDSVLFSEVDLHELSHRELQVLVRDLRIALSNARSAAIDSLERCEQLGLMGSLTPATYYWWQRNCTT